MYIYIYIVMVFLEISLYVTPLIKALQNLSIAVDINSNSFLPEGHKRCRFLALWPCVRLFLPLGSLSGLPSVPPGILTSISFLYILCFSPLLVSFLALIAVCFHIFCLFMCFNLQKKKYFHYIVCS